jgi:hypothetical protein
LVNFVTFSDLQETVRTMMQRASTTQGKIKLSVFPRKAREPCIKPGSQSPGLISGTPQRRHKKGTPLLSLEGLGPYRNRYPGSRILAHFRLPIHHSMLSCKSCYCVLDSGSLEVAPRLQWPDRPGFAPGSLYIRAKTEPCSQPCGSASLNK